MEAKQILLITGAAGYWGSRVAARLMAEGGCQVIGLDTEHPVVEVPGLDFVRADIRNPLLGKLLAAEGVTAVCHLAFRDTQRPSEAAFDSNVMGTTHVLGACAEASVRKVILKSSMAVYGARVTNPAFLSEDHHLQGSRRYGYIRDLVETEVLCNGFRRRAPQMALTILRFPEIVGPTADTRLTRFLKQPWAPSLLGFDPMMQVIHEDDVVEALAHALLHDRPGVFNVAAEGILPLSKVRGLAGKPPLLVFHKFAYWGASLPGGLMPIPPDYLRYPWVGDLGRMRREFGFEPLHTAEQTLREFAQCFRLEHYQERSSRGAVAEKQLQEIIDERRRARG